MSWRRGPEVLRAWLEETGPDPRYLGDAELLRWFAELLDAQRRNPAYALQLEIAERTRGGGRALQQRERAARRAREAWEASPDSARHGADQRALEGARRAVEGLSGAVARGDAKPERLEEFQRKLGELEDRLARRERRSQALRALRVAEAALTALRDRLGLSALEDRLETLRREAGHRHQSGGERFEDLAAEGLDELLRPELVARWGEPLHLLRGVALGCSRAEFDHLYVRPRPGGGGLVDVVALVEAKSAPDEIAEGRARREENLAWFRGRREAYDASLYRTQAWPSGHFEGEARYEEHGFDADSFAPLGEPGNWPGLYLATRKRRLRWLDGGFFGRLADAALRDPRLDPGHSGCAERLRSFLAAWLEVETTPELLRRLLESGLGDRVLVHEAGA